MSTTLLFFALSGFLASAIETPTWTNDYDAARKLGVERKKPLAVFIGSGRAGWKKLCQEGELGKDVNKLLSAKYVCVYLDTELEPGKRWAAKFDVGEGPGIVVSDHSGDVQAFRHEGDLAMDRLERYLQKYADPQRAVRTTETDRPQRVSYYPASDFGSQTNTFFPATYSGRSC